MQQKPQRMYESTHLLNLVLGAIQMRQQFELADSRRQFGNGIVLHVENCQAWHLVCRWGGKREREGEKERVESTVTLGSAQESS